MVRVTGETWRGRMETLGVEEEEWKEKWEKMKVWRWKKDKMAEEGGERAHGTQERSPGWCVFGGQGGVMGDICTAHGHPWWFIYPRPPDQTSDLPVFVRLEGAPYHTTQFLTFHISSNFQLPFFPLPLKPTPVWAKFTCHLQRRRGKTGPGRCQWRSACIRDLGLDRVRLLQGDLVSSGMRGDHQHLRSRVVAPLRGFILFNQAEATFGNGVELLKSWLLSQEWLSMVENCLLRQLTNEKVERKKNACILSWSWLFSFFTSLIYVWMSDFVVGPSHFLCWINKGCVIVANV